MQGWLQQHQEGLISDKQKTETIINVGTREKVRRKCNINIFYMVGNIFHITFQNGSL